MSQKNHYVRVSLSGSLEIVVHGSVSLTAKSKAVCRIIQANPPCEDQSPHARALLRAIEDNLKRASTTFRRKESCASGMNDCDVYMLSLTINTVCQGSSVKEVSTKNYPITVELFELDCKDKRIYEKITCDLSGMVSEISYQEYCGAIRNGISSCGSWNDSHFVTHTWNEFKKLSGYAKKEGNKRDNGRKESPISPMMNSRLMSTAPPRYQSEADNTSLHSYS